MPRGGQVIMSQISECKVTWLLAGNLNTWNFAEFCSNPNMTYLMTTKIIIDFFSKAIVTRNMFADAELSPKCHPQPFISRNFSLYRPEPSFSEWLEKKRTKRGAVIACTFEKTNKKSHTFDVSEIAGVSRNWCMDELFKGHPSITVVMLSSFHVEHVAE